MMHRPAPHCRDLRFERSPHHVGQSRRRSLRQKFLVFIAGCFIKAISDDLIRSDDFNLDFGNIRIPDELNTTMTKWNDRRGRSRWRQDFGQHASQGKTERVLAHFGRSAAVPIIFEPRDVSEGRKRRTQPSWFRSACRNIDLGRRYEKWNYQSLGEASGVCTDVPG